MFSASSHVTSQRLMIKSCAIATLEILKAHGVASGDPSRVDYEHTYEDAHQRFLERIEHGMKRKPDAQERHESGRHLMFIDQWSHGLVYCPIAKTDPHLLPFHKLDATRRYKDELVLCSILFHAV